MRRRPLARVAESSFLAGSNPARRGRKASMEASTAVSAVIAAAREMLGDRLSTNASIREQHSHGEDTTTPTLPDAVAFVETTEEVSRLLALCHQHGVGHAFRRRHLARRPCRRAACAASASTFRA
jgi:hypothetical protein